MPAIRISSSADLTALLDLFAHEKVIEEGLATFFDVGWALLRIRDTSKYRAAGYDSFEQYCRRRWGWSRKHSRRLMAAVETAALLPPESGIPRPQTEAQLRPLTPLRHRPDLVYAAWARALEAANGDQPTPTEVVVAVQHLRRPRLLEGASPPPVPKEPAPAPARGSKEPAPVGGGPGPAASR